MSLDRTTTDVVQANASVTIANIQQFSVNNNGVGYGIPNNVPTKLTFSTVEYDINKGFTIATARYTPIPGTTMNFHAAVGFGAVPVGTVLQAAIFRNGFVYKSGTTVHAAGAAALSATVDCSAMVALNDFFEFFVTQVSGAPQVISGLTNDTWFQGEQRG